MRGNEILPFYQSQMIREAKFAHSPLRKFLKSKLIKLKIKGKNQVPRFKSAKQQNPKLVKRIFLKEVENFSNLKQ